MSEPQATASRVEEIAPGLWHWMVWDDRIEFDSHAYAVTGAGGTVLIDPLPLAEEAMSRLSPVIAICLTAACHQRAAWRYRRVFGVQVHAPEGSRAMDEIPDAYYHDHDILPGGLKAIQTPGPEVPHFSFWTKHSPGIVFCPDLVLRGENGELSIPDELHEDPGATRDSLRRLLDMPFSILCLSHGDPITSNPQAAIRRLL